MIHVDITAAGVLSSPSGTSAPLGSARVRCLARK
jgi:hypothetical protein